jgi:sirohydrochlorin ferrochelatase
LVLAAHGSSDPRYPAVFDWIAGRIVGSRPDLDVLVGYLDHCEPRLANLPTAGAVVVPMLLGAGYHLDVDLPGAAPEAIIADLLGPDPRLVAAVAHRLAEAGWTTGMPVTLAAAGSSHESGLADVRRAAAALAELLAVEVSTAYVGTGEPALADLAPQAVATYLLAPGRFAERIGECGALIVSAPIGSDPRVAEVAMSRYDAALPLF